MCAVYMCMCEANKEGLILITASSRRSLSIRSASACSSLPRLDASILRHGELLCWAALAACTALSTSVYADMRHHEVETVRTQIPVSTQKGCNTSLAVRDFLKCLTFAFYNVKSMSTEWINNNTFCLEIFQLPSYLHLSKCPVASSNKAILQI